MLRRDVLKQAAGLLFGKQFGPLSVDCYGWLAKRPFERVPTGSFLQQLQQVVKNIETVRLAVGVIYDYLIQEFMYDTAAPLPTIPKRNHPSWPYLHCLGHCFATAVLTDLSPAERREWSVWMGLQDELTQTYWAEFFRKTVHPLMVRQIRLEHPADDRQAAIELGTSMMFIFGTRRQKMQALTKIKLWKPEAYKVLSDVRSVVAPLVDACESAWQRSDLLDNAIGREGGLLCPKNLSIGDKVTWCMKWCHDHNIFRDTPEGPDTDRPWGPFHPINPGPVPSWLDVVFGIKFIPAEAAHPHRLYCEPSALMGIEEP
jgi:hypothetical protein